MGGAEYHEGFGQEKSSSSDLIEYFVTNMAQGKSWGHVLLDTIGAWTHFEENHKGRRYNYLIQGEAFDWLLLAERILNDIPKTIIPLIDKQRMLFSGYFEWPVSDLQFQEVIGSFKYQGFLNFFYGVVVEEALIHAVEEEVIKERDLLGLQDKRGVDDIVMARLYGDALGSLIRKFFKSSGKRYRGFIPLRQWKAFVYWLFKLRLSNSDSSRLASDTNKGLRQLELVRMSGAPNP
jgi:hypothetical protein